MPNSVRVHRLLPVLLLAAALGSLALGAPRAHAATSQVSMIEDDHGMFTNPLGTMEQFRVLGVQEVRIPVRWQVIAPNANSYHRPASFNAADPGAHGYNWKLFDNIAVAAAETGVAVNFDLVGGAPLWATGPGSHGHAEWEPSASQFAQFVRAAGERYSGDYSPSLRRLAPGDPSDLPAVQSWSVWNEPNYGPSLAPQGLPGHLTIDYAPRMYRSLLDAAWGALQRTGHGHDTILFGEVADRGEPYWGEFSGMTPLLFLRSLYCLDGSYRPLRGSAARVRGCPTTAAGSRAFRAAHPALFAASGFADHPYMRWYAPNHELSPDPVSHTSTIDYSSLGTMARFERGLDRVQRAYGARGGMPVYDTEFGYITTPPKRRWSHDQYPWISQATAAYYLNWAEYIHWHDRRLASYMQYLLRDPVPALRSNDYGSFASGLLNYNGTPKPTYAAWRLPLYLPVTQTKRGRSLEVWGCVRPAHYALADGQGPQTVQIQLAPGSNPSAASYQTVATATLTSARNCYFDVHVGFPGSGLESVRLLWRYPTTDPLGYFEPLVRPGTAVTSRTVLIRLR